MVLVILIMGEMKSISHIEREREREREDRHNPKPKNKVLATTATTRNNSSSSTSEKQHHLIYLFALPFQPTPTNSHWSHPLSSARTHPRLSVSLSLTAREEKEEKTRRTLSLSLYTEAKKTQVIQIRKKRHGDSTHPILKNNEESTPPNSLSLFLQWPSWTKIYV